jgi:hypothetical protein
VRSNVLSNFIIHSFQHNLQHACTVQLPAAGTWLRKTLRAMHSMMWCATACSAVQCGTACSTLALHSCMLQESGFKLLFALRTWLKNTERATYWTTRCAIRMFCTGSVLLLSREHVME